MTTARQERALDSRHGPRYPDLGVRVAKLRASDPYDAKAHGRAVLEAIGRLNQSIADRYAKKGYTSPCPCASGTYHSSGKDILAAVGRQNRARAEAQPLNWYTPEQQRSLYKAAIAAKKEAARHD